MGRIRKILSIDGGGIRGIIPALVLFALEKRFARPLWKVFDLVAGTSTGGILAAAIAAGIPSENYPGMYVRNASRIFRRSWSWKLRTKWGLKGPKFPIDGLRETLQEELGEKPFSQVLTNVLITAYDLRTQRPYFFKSWHRDQGNIPLWSAALASSAAPTYFPPVTCNEHLLIDGGVFATNPAMCALASTFRLWPDDSVLLVSLGTGHKPPFEDANEAGTWGLVGWAKHIVSTVFDGSSDAVDYQVGTILPKVSYFRLQTSSEVPMDATGREALKTLLVAGQDLIHTATFRQIVREINHGPA